jgi:hypothetical protein
MTREMVVPFIRFASVMRKPGHKIENGKPIRPRNRGQLTSSSSLSTSFDVAT